jgi:hypothetical protein
MYVNLVFVLKKSDRTQMGGCTETVSCRRFHQMIQDKNWPKDRSMMHELAVACLVSGNDYITPLYNMTPVMWIDAFVNNVDRLDPLVTIENDRPTLDVQSYFRYIKVAYCYKYKTQISSYVLEYDAHVNASDTSKPKRDIKSQKKLKIIDSFRAMTARDSNVMIRLAKITPRPIKKKRKSKKIIDMCESDPMIDLEEFDSTHMDVEDAVTDDKTFKCYCDMMTWSLLRHIVIVKNANQKARIPDRSDLWLRYVRQYFNVRYITQQWRHDVRFTDDACERFGYTKTNPSDALSKYNIREITSEDNPIINAVDEIVMWDM